MNEKRQYAISKRARKLIGKRTRAALQAKRERGERISDLPPYGFQYRGDRMIEHRGEQQVIQRMIALKREGHSLRGIGRELTLKGIPSRSGQWHHTVIRDALRRAGMK